MKRIKVKYNYNNDVGQEWNGIYSTEKMIR